MLPLDSLQTIYYALFFPHLSYGIIAWGSVDNRGLNRQTELLQKRAICTIHNAFCNSHTDQKFRKCQNSSNYMIFLNTNHFYLHMTSHESFIMEYLVAIENTCYVIFIGAILYMIYSIGPINVCTDFEINRYKIYEIRKYAKIVFYLTSRDAKTLRHAPWGLPTLLIGILIRNILKPTRGLYDFRFKSDGSNSGFRVFGDLDLDL